MRFTVILTLGLIGCAHDEGATHLLEVSVTGKGVVTAATRGIACAGRCSYPLPADERVALLATAEPGHRLETWSGACSTGACELTMSEDRTVEARFVALDAADRVQRLPLSTEPLVAKVEVAVDIAGDLAIVGIRNGVDRPGDQPPIFEDAQIFERRAGKWLRLERLAPVNKAGFGHAVAIDGDWAVVGAHFVKALYFYGREGAKWSQLRFDPKETLPYFGVSVALERTTAAAGAFNPATKDGQVHVLELVGQTWKETARIDRPGRFGFSIALDGGTMLVGAPDHGANGAAYVFEKTDGGWKEVARLETSAKETGTVVALNAGVALVGASSSTFVFERAGSTWTRKFSLPVDKKADGIGGNNRENIAGNTLVVGNTTASGDAGAVRIARRLGGTWVEGPAIVALDGQAGDKLGAAVAIGVNTVIAAAPGKDDVTTDEGAVYFFELP
jgi:hypothetical protein